MDFLAQYNLTGLVIGVATFLIIGLFHPLVIKGEYYFGVKIWWIFLVMGIAAIAASIAVHELLVSTLLAVWGASSLWSIGELFEQRKRVARGWFPRNPARRYPDSEPELSSRRDAGSGPVRLSGRTPDAHPEGSSHSNNSTDAARR